MSLLENLFNVDVVRWWDLPMKPTGDEDSTVMFYCDDSSSKNTEEKTSNLFLSSKAHIVEIWDSRAPRVCASIETESDQAELTNLQEIISSHKSYVRIWDCRKLSSPIDVKTYAKTSQTNEISSLSFPIELRFFI
jgi:hypothetical protein